MEIIPVKDWKGKREVEREGRRKKEMREKRKKKKNLRSFFLGSSSV